jgi:hypothetical protein
MFLSLKEKISTDCSVSNGLQTMNEATGLIVYSCYLDGNVNAIKSVLIGLFFPILTGGVRSLKSYRAQTEKCLFPLLADSMDGDYFNSNLHFRFNCLSTNSCTELIAGSNKLMRDWMKKYCWALINLPSTNTLMGPLLLALCGAGV